MRGSVWSGPGADPADLDGDLDRAASVNGRWVFRFPAQPPLDREIVLRIEPGAATLEVGKERAACAAFRLLVPMIMSSAGTP